MAGMGARCIREGNYTIDTTANAQSTREAIGGSIKLAVMPKTRMPNISSPKTMIHRIISHFKEEKVIPWQSSHCVHTNHTTYLSFTGHFRIGARGLRPKGEFVAY